MVKSVHIFRYWWFLPTGFLLFGIVFLFRYPSDPETLRVYYRAGTNIFELTKTLDHFRKDPDPRKYEAARFLIRNMERQYTRMDGYTDMKIEWLADHFDEVKSRFNIIDDSLEVAWTDLKKENRAIKLQDASIIKSEFLIEHMDQAFEVWDTSPWRQHFSFSQFCEYFLPYKSNQGPPQKWLDYYRAKYGHVLERQGDTLDTREFIFQLIDEFRPRYSYYVPKLRRHSGALEMDRAPAGDCRFLAQWQDYIFRSMGLPVIVINSVWAYAGEGHFWNAWMDLEGNWNEIMPRGDSILRWEATPPKIFARHWGRQDDSFAAIAYQTGLDDEDIPDKLRSWNLVDITEDIIPTSNITVSYDEDLRDPGNPFVYLAVSDDHDWEPLHWSFPEEGEATFTQMGRNMLYLPVLYDNGVVTPAGEIFIINDSSEILDIEPDTEQLMELEIDRLYPLRQWVMNLHVNQMRSGTIEASNNMEFQPADTLFHMAEKIRSNPDRYEAPELKGRWTYDVWWQDIEIGSSTQYRYIRYRAGKDKETVIGDLEVYGEDGHRIDPVSFFGHGEHPEYLSDGVPGEYFMAPDLGSWGAMDLGSPQKISKIRFIPHDIDPASIQTGDEYRLYVWNGNDWQPLSEIQAKKKSIPIQIHPYGLYLLEDLSRFVHRRPFWYNPEKGIIEWW